MTVSDKWLRGVHDQLGDILCDLEDTAKDSDHDSMTKKVKVIKHDVAALRFKVEHALEQDYD